MNEGRVSSFQCWFFPYFADLPVVFGHIWVKAISVSYGTLKSCIFGPHHISNLLSQLSIDDFLCSLFEMGQGKRLLHYPSFLINISDLFRNPFGVFLWILFASFFVLSIGLVVYPSLILLAGTNLLMSCYPSIFRNRLLPCSSLQLCVFYVFIHCFVLYYILPDCEFLRVTFLQMFHLSLQSRLEGVQAVQGDLMLLFDEKRERKTLLFHLNSRNCHQDSLRINVST